MAAAAWVPSRRRPVAHTTGTIAAVSVVTSAGSGAMVRACVLTEAAMYATAAIAIANVVRIRASSLARELRTFPSIPSLFSLKLCR
jgi:hypothetical protein